MREDSAKMVAECGIGKANFSACILDYKHLCMIHDNGDLNINLFPT